jgi:hypothetical protein
MGKQPTLVDAIASLLGRDRPSKIRLKRGLTLSYRPAGAGRAHNLSLGRWNEFPSSTELAIVKRDLRRALRKLARPYGAMQVETYRHGRGWGYHTIEWTEYRQMSLLQQAHPSQETTT